MQTLTSVVKDWKSEVVPANGWIEDAALGVAVRVVGPCLQVRGLCGLGGMRINVALCEAYGERWNDEYVSCGLSAGRDVNGVFYIIDPAHRLAFDRALGLTACATCGGELEPSTLSAQQVSFGQRSAVVA